MGDRAGALFAGLIQAGATSSGRALRQLHPAAEMSESASCDAAKKGASLRAMLAPRPRHLSLHTLDLNLLVVFEALLRTRSTTLTGEQIGVTQSAVSNALRRLREYFADELFVRTEQGMMPTALAVAMSASIQASLGQIRLTIESRGEFDPQVSQRTFHIAMSDMGQMGLLPSLLNELREFAPNVGIETIEINRVGLAERLASGEIDLVVGAIKPLGAGFVRQVLKTGRFCCVARKGNPSVHAGMTLQDFVQATFIEYYPAGGSYGVYAEHAERVFNEAGARPRIGVRLAHLSGIESMLARSDLLAVVSQKSASYLLSVSAELQIFELPFESPEISITQQWHERVNKDLGHMWIRSVVARILG